MFKMKSIIATTAITLMMVASGSTDEIKAGDLLLENIRARATLPGAPVAGGYLTITNTGSTSDRLIGGSVSFAAKVEVHEMKIENDVMKMRQMTDGIEIPAGATVELKPGGYHLMFMKPAEQLKEGESREGVLEFDNAGSVTVKFDVVKLGKSMKHGSHGKMKHGEKMKDAE